MKSCIFLIVLLAVICSSWAAVYQIEESTHKDFPNQCYHDGQAFSVGVHRPKGKCYEIKCTESFAVQQYSCGKVGTEKGWHNEIDLSKPYPDCCVNIVKDAE